MNKVTISIVVPVYSGQDYLPQLIEEISTLRSAWEENNHTVQLLEAIFVNDCAIDQSGTILEKAAIRFPWVKGITLSKNYGQHPATVAGILYSSGDWIATLDEDLQHSPNNIIDLLRVVAETGADIVYAKPTNNVHRRGYRDFASRTYKKILSRLTGNPIIRQFNSFRLIRGAVARAAASVCSHDTFFDVSLNWFTNRVESLQLEMHDSRYAKTGKSSYNIYKLLSHARRMITSSQTKLLRFGAAIGILAMLVSIILVISILYGYFMNTGDYNVRGWTSLFIAIMFFGGISAFLIGIALEYLTNIVLHFQGKPVFFVIDRSLDDLLRKFFTQ